MNCKKGQCEKCGLFWELTSKDMQGKETTATACAFVVIFSELGKINHNMVGLRKDMDMRGNAAVGQLKKIVTLPGGRG